MKIRRLPSRYTPQHVMARAITVAASCSERPPSLTNARQLGKPSARCRMAPRAPVQTLAENSSGGGLVNAIILVAIRPGSWPR